MAGDREELEELRRLEELEARAASQPSPGMGTGMRLLRGLATGGPVGLVGAGMGEALHGLDKIGETAGDATVDALSAVSGRRGALNPLGLTIPPEVTGAVATAAKLGPGMLVGGVGGAKAGAPVMEAGAKRLMQSALKPPPVTLAGGVKSDAAKAIQTMLDEGVNVTAGGAAKMRNLITQLNDDVMKHISASPAVVDKAHAMRETFKVLQKFRKQVNPESDMRKVLDSWNEFNRFAANTIPIKEAQALKQGTYKVLSDKYARGGAPAVENEAATQAQMAQARGLRLSIEDRIPEVAKLNKRESDIINALEIAEKRAGIADNRDLAGIAWLAQNPAAATAMFADRSPLFKSILARMLYGGRTTIPAGAGAVAGAPRDD